MSKITRSIVNRSALPEHFPTHKHEPDFWESLGRTVATFGFLEETLAKAIFAFTVTLPCNEEESQEAFEKWLPQLQRILTEQLWNLIESYGKTVRTNPNASIVNLAELIGDLKEAAKLRNVICHGSWRSPNSGSASVPFFINRQHERFDTEIDIVWLGQLQKHVSELICAVINTVTHMGWEFPGGAGQGNAIWEVEK